MERLASGKSAFMWLSSLFCQHPSQMGWNKRNSRHCNHYCCPCFGFLRMSFDHFRLSQEFFFAHFRLHRCLPWLHLARCLTFVEWQVCYDQLHLGIEQPRTCLLFPEGVHGRYPVRNLSKTSSES